MDDEGHIRSSPGSRVTQADTDEIDRKMDGTEDGPLWTLFLFMILGNIYQSILNFTKKHDFYHDSRAYSKRVYTPYNVQYFFSQMQISLWDVQNSAMISYNSMIRFLWCLLFYRCISPFLKHEKLIYNSLWGGGEGERCTCRDISL